MKKLTLIALLFALTACVSKQEIMQSEYSKSVYVNENYQSVFKRLRDQMDKCLATGIVLPLSPVSHEFDAQLYGDLGYGELSYYQKNLSKIYYHFVKVPVRVKLLVASSSSHWLPIHTRSRGVEHLRSFRVERDHVDVRPVTC